MKAMLLKEIVNLSAQPNPLVLSDVPVPIPVNRDVLIKVSACGVCHTELDEIEGRTPPPQFPVIPGHQVVGRIVKTGNMAKKFNHGDRVGVGWIYSSCGTCSFCRKGDENLCPDFRATGRDANGGYSQYMVVPEDYAFPIPDEIGDSEAAPLLCAGAIGYRSLKLTHMVDGRNLGLTGFGASAHLVLKMARYQYPHSKIVVFARSERERLFALELGADWAGDTEETSPILLDDIIDTTPVWKPVIEALRNLAAGGRIVINAIRKEHIDQEELLRLNYPVHLWMEKEIKSVANVSRSDIREFLQLAAQIPIKPEIEEFALEDANRALQELKERRIRGAKVLRIA